MAQTNFFVNARDLGDTDLHMRRLGEDYTLAKAKVKGARGTYVLPVRSALHSHSVARVVQVNPTTSISSVTWSALPVEFKVDNNSIDVLEEYVLEVNVYNDTGGNVTYNSVFDLIDRIELRIGPQTVQTLTGLALKQLLQFMTHEEFLRLQPNLSMSTSYGAASATADSTASTFYLPVKFSLLQQAARSFFVPGIKQDVVIRVTLSPLALVTTTGAAIKLTGLKLHLIGRELAPADRAALMEAHESGPIDYRFLDLVQQTITTGSETSGSTYSQQLNGITGLVAFLIVVARASGFTGSNVATHRSLTQVEVTDASGTNLLGGNAFADAFARGVYSDALDLPGQYQIAANTYPYVLSWSPRPMEAVLFGVMNGGLPFKSTHRLRYIAGTTGTTQLDVMAFVYRRLRIERGIVLPVISS